MAEYVDMPWASSTSMSGAVSHGGLIWTSGHVGVDAGAEDIDFGMQCEVALQRLLESVEKAGGSLETILRVGAYLDSMDDFERWDAVYRRIIDRSPMPVRTTVAVGSLISPMRIEVECTAFVRDPK